MSDTNFDDLPEDLNKMFEDLVNEIEKEAKARATEDSLEIIRMPLQEAFKILKEGDPRLSYTYDYETERDAINRYTSAVMIFENLIVAYDKNPSIADIYSNKPIGLYPPNI